MSESESAGDIQEYLNILQGNLSKEVITEDQIIPAVEIPKSII